MQDSHTSAPTEQTTPDRDRLRLGVPPTWRSSERPMSDAPGRTGPQIPRTPGQPRRQISARYARPQAISGPYVTVGSVSDHAS